jgi:DNA-binding beta-propeller fold protein YncE
MRSRAGGRRHPGRALALLGATALALAVVTVAGAVGELTQKAGPAGCISQIGTGETPCGDATALRGIRGVAVSADGKSVYAVSIGPGVIAIFDRDPSTGALTQKPGAAGCFVRTGAGGTCREGRALNGAERVAVSMDGKSAYVVAVGSKAVAVFDRDPLTGTLSQKAGTDACIAEVGGGGTCLDGRALDDAVDVAVSGDGRSVYVASLSPADAVAIMDRDPKTGALQQKLFLSGCVSETGTRGACQDGRALENAAGVAVSADGRNVYVTASGSDAVAVFDRDPETGALRQRLTTDGCVSDTGTSGTCRDGRALNFPTGVTVSADGKSVYVAASGSDAVGVFERDPATGALSQKAETLGCVSETGAGPCEDGRALRGVVGVALSPDGASVYAYGPAGVAVFDRDPATGALRQKPGTSGCFSSTTPGCERGRALSNPKEVVTSPDGRHVYVGAMGSEAIAIFDRAAAPPPAPPPSPDPPAPAPPAEPPKDTLAPVVSAFSVAAATRRAATFRFRLSERATTRIVVARALPGRTVAGRCLAPAPQRRSRPGCTRLKPIGAITFRDRPAGRNSVAFRGQTGLRSLVLGHYRATITATDAAGNRSRARQAGFRVVRR